MSQTQTEAKDQAESLVVPIVQKTRGSKVESVTRLTGGVVNQVFLIKCRTENLVLRMNADCLPIYVKEEWAMAQAKANAVSVPAVFAVGEIDSVSYMLMEHEPGVMLSTFTGNRKKAFFELGRQAKLTNSIKVQGFGFHLDWSGRSPVFTKSWSEVVKEEQEMLFSTNALANMGALSKGQVIAAEKFLAARYDWQPEPRLCHGDLNANNVLVHKDEIVILDWTQTKGGAAPFFDLAGLSMKDPGEFEALCLGYGLTASQIAEYRKDFERVCLTDVLRAAVWAHQVKHPQIEKFVRDVQESYDKILAR